MKEAHEVAGDAGDDPVDGRGDHLVANRTSHQDLVGIEERWKAHRVGGLLDDDDGPPSIGGGRSEGLDGTVEVGPTLLPVRSTDREPDAQQRRPAPRPG